MSAHCCCCIPLRAGVLVLSPITFLAAGALSGLIIWSLSYGLVHPHSPETPSHPLPKSTKAIAGAYAGLMMLLALVSILGFAGGVRRSAGLVRGYGVVLLLAWFAGLGLGAVHIALSFKNRDETVENCKNEQAERWAGNEQMIEIGQGTCEFHFKLVTGLFISVWLVFHLVTLYFVFVALRAARLLAREQSDVALGTYAYPGGGASLSGAGGRHGGRPGSGSNATLPVIAGGGGRTASYASGMTASSSLAEKRGGGGGSDDDGASTVSMSVGRKKTGGGLFGAAITNAASNIAAQQQAESGRGSGSSSGGGGGKGQKSMQPPNSSFEASSPTPTAATAGNGGGNPSNSTFLARYASRSSSRDGEGEGGWGGEAR